MKIFCNKCYQPLVVHTYDIGLFVNICECVEKSAEFDIEEAFQAGHNDGFDEGYDAGYKVDPEGEDK